MKVALTVWENRISPVFDSARMILVVEVESGAVVSRHYEPFGSERSFYRATKLSKLEVNVLICGAISQFYANMIEAYGIQVIPFIAGDVNVGGVIVDGIDVAVAGIGAAARRLQFVRDVRNYQFLVGCDGAVDQHCPHNQRQHQSVRRRCRQPAIP